MFLWAAPLGIAAALLAFAIRRIALALRSRVEPRMVLLMPVLGVAIGGLAAVFSQITDKPVSDVLFSGQDQLPGLLQHASTWSVGALVALIAFKGVAYGISLSSFRGGPVFPSMFIGAAGGLAAAQLPGLSMVPAVAMGIGAMCASMLTLPLTATLLATLLLGEDGVQSMPVVIVAVVVAFVVTARLPLPATDGDSAPAPPSPASDAAPKPVVIPSG
jgi:H+/Cl- antiporter ClcA